MSRLIFRVRAIKRMFEREIGDADVRYVLATGTLMEETPEESSFVFRRRMAHPRSRVIDVVSAEEESAERIVIVTVYESPREAL